MGPNEPLAHRLALTLTDAQAYAIAVECANRGRALAVGGRLRRTIVGALRPEPEQDGATASLALVTDVATVKEVCPEPGRDAWSRITGSRSATALLVPASAAPSGP